MVRRADAFTGKEHIRGKTNGTGQLLPLDCSALEVEISRTSLNEMRVVICIGVLSGFERTLSVLSTLLGLKECVIEFFTRGCCGYY